MKDFTLLVGRAAIGLLVAGHGVQKLFGWFEGPGFTQWTSLTETRMGLKPGRFWGTMQILGEAGGGVLTALGFLNPLGPIGVAASMAAAAYKGHWGKPIWAARGGPELSVSFLAGAALAAAAGPGRYSLDAMLGIRLPRWVTGLAVLASAAMVAEIVRPTVTPRLVGPPPASPEGNQA
ncbi:MAG: DoxX family protein [Chloroflexi bacterium]|nr:DoxX family protein [Chloroflexota bacterium]